MTAENGNPGKAGDHEVERAQVFKIIIDKTHHETRNPTPTGRELLELAGLKPVEHFGIYLKHKGAQPQRIKLDETVDLRAPGVERFVTLPLDQTEG